MKGALVPIHLLTTNAYYVKANNTLVYSLILDIIKESRCSHKVSTRVIFLVTHFRRDITMISFTWIGFSKLLHKWRNYWPIQSKVSDNYHSYLQGTTKLLENSYRYWSHVLIISDHSNHLLLKNTVILVLRWSPFIIAGNFLWAPLGILSNIY